MAMDIYFHWVKIFVDIFYPRKVAKFYIHCI